MILDVGCGKNKRGDVGVDYSRESAADVICDAEFLPFKDSSFDGVKSIVCLEHSPNPLNFLKEQYRILKPHGKIMCETDNAQFYRWSVIGFRGFQHEKYHDDHYMIFFPENVVRLFKRVGFKQVSWQFVPTEASKMNILAQLLVRIRFWRSESLYGRFRVFGGR